MSTYPAACSAITRRSGPRLTSPSPSGVAHDEAHDRPSPAQSLVVLEISTTRRTRARSDRQMVATAAHRHLGRNLRPAGRADAGVCSPAHPRSDAARRAARAASGSLQHRVRLVDAPMMSGWLPAAWAITDSARSRRRSLGIASWNAIRACLHARQSLLEILHRFLELLYLSPERDEQR